MNTKLYHIMSVLRSRIPVCPVTERDLLIQTFYLLQNLGKSLQEETCKSESIIPR